ncbi:MAG: sensor domain-containing diguanylate cyclase [Chloroflexi bacterium]|nr:sensor domain-containing diguanylate cyclase [Chloroflexota bacterium]
MPDPTPPDRPDALAASDAVEVEMLRRLVDASPDAVLIVQDRRFRYDNQALHRTPEDNRIGLLFADRAPPAQQPAIWATLDAVQAGELPEGRVEWESVVTGRVLEAILRPITYEGAPAVAAFVRDVTERAHLEQAMEQQARELADAVDSLTLYRRIFELSRDSVVLMQDGVVQLSNGALLGGGSPSIVGQRVEALFDAKTLVWLRAEAQRILSGELEEGLWEWPIADGSDRVRTVEAIARRIEYRGRPALLINTRDVTERKAVEVRLQEMSRTDALTEIPNRRAFYEALTYWRDEARRSKARHAVCYIDLDGFKSVNDDHGHRAGDDLLVEIARRFRETVRRTDILARLGGDEFAVLLPATTEAGAREVAEKLLADVLAASGVHPGVSASIGVTTFGADDAPDDVISRADREMYRVKMVHRADQLSARSRQQRGAP